MNYYFELQIRRIKRWFDYIGIQPAMGFIAAIISFIILAQVMFYKTSYAPYLLISLCLSLLLKLGGSRRNELIHLLYGPITSRKIRVGENLIIAIPFSLYLLYEQQWCLTGLMIIGSTSMSLIKSNRSINWVIPTPYKRLVFEYTTGFRKYVWLIIIVYYIFGQSIRVENFTLSMVCLIALGLLGMSFVMLLEHRYFIWLHSKEVRAFLWHKSIVAIASVSILVAPAMGFLIFTYFDQWVYVLGGYVLVMLYQVFGLLTKYSAYPKELSLVKTIILVVGILCPPLIPFILISFYLQSENNIFPLLS